MQSRLVLKILAIVAIVLLAAFVRLRAVERLPIDYDEDDYLRAAQQFATAIQANDWAAFTQLNYRTEHPPLTKIINGIVIAPLLPAPEIPDVPTTAPPAKSLPEPHLTFARVMQATQGVLAVLMLAIINPLAAFFLAVDTWHIKYTSQVMLEALPTLTSLVTVWAYVQSKRKWNRWLIVSALALGLTAASKYTYCIVAVAIGIDWLMSLRQARATKQTPTLSMFPVIAWGALALAIFLVADPYLWVDPINRLRDSVLYHAGYAASQQVASAGHPMWQPLVWLAESVPWSTNAFVIAIDSLIALFAIAGFTRLWQKQNVYALWLVIGLGFLLIWPTKWPQYVLTILAPLSLSAAEGFLAWVWEPLRDAVIRWRTRQPSKPRERLSWRDALRALPWLAPGLITLSIITLFPLAFQGAMSLTDLNSISLRDGMNGGVWRAVWQGVTGQTPPVKIRVGDDGRTSVQVEIQDRGEPRLVSLADASLSTRDVHFAGLDWYSRILSGIGANILVFEIVWTVCSIATQLALGLIIALMLNRRGVRFKAVWQAIFILPWAIPEFVGVMVWLHVFEPTNGWLALALGTEIPWHENSLMALGVLLVSALWMGFPFMMLASTAGLKMIPPDVYDAAAVDGAGRWNQFRYVTLPMLFPLLGPAIIVRSIFAFNQFYLFYVLRPPGSMLTFATFSFYMLNSTSRLGGQYAFSAVINIVTVIVLIALLVWFNRRTRVAEGVTYA